MSGVVGIGLMVLKWIGIILLVLLRIFLGILFIFLLLLSTLLFVPIRYKMGIKYEKESLSFHADIHFLFRLLRAKIDFETGLSYRVKVLFFTIFSSLKKKKERKKRKDGKKERISQKVERKKEEEARKTETKEAETPKRELEERKAGITEEKKEEKTEQSDNKENTKEKQSTETEKIVETKDEKDFFEKVEEKWEKAVEFGEGVVEKTEKVRKTYEETMRKKEILLKFWNSAGTVEGLELLLSQSMRLVKALLPKKIEGRLCFGTGDVYTEGQYLTYLCLLYGLYADKLVIEPEWEEEVLEVDLDLKGRVRLFTILRICIKVYFNDDFRKLRDNFDFMRTRLGF